MFNRNNPKPNSRIDTLVGAETVINGDINFSGGLRVDGRVCGNINEIGGKSGTLVLSELGSVEGAINVSHAVINGKVHGPISARSYIELQAKARVTGDVCYKTLEIHMGGVVEGKLIYLAEAQTGTPAPATRSNIDPLA